LTVPPQDPSYPPVPPTSGPTTPGTYGTARRGPFPPQPAAAPAFQPPGATPPPAPPAGPATAAFSQPLSGPPSSGPPSSGGGAYGYEPPAVPPVPAPAPRAGGGLLVAVSVVALLLSLTAAALSVYAIGVANGAKNSNAAAPAPAANNGKANATGAQNPTAGRNATTNGAPTPRSSAGELDPKAQFTEAYTPSSQTLTIHPAQGERYIDLDKPQVGVDSRIADLILYAYSSEEYFHFPNEVDVATARSRDVSPGECVDLIQRSSLPNEAHVPVRTEDLTLCIATSFDRAKNQGISWKMVVVHVNSISTDGTVEVAVKAWNIPD
jgi:hypothetical protein